MRKQGSGLDSENRTDRTTEQHQLLLRPTDGPNQRRHVIEHSPQGGCSRRHAVAAKFGEKAIVTKALDDGNEATEIIGDDFAVTMEMNDGFCTRVRLVIMAGEPGVIDVDPEGFGKPFAPREKITLGNQRMIENRCGHKKPGR